MTDAQILALIQSALESVAPGRAEEFAGLTFQSAITDLRLDSISTLEMVGAIEEALGATFGDEELARVRTLGDLGALVRGAG